MRKLTHEEILHRQRLKSTRRQLSFCAVLNNIRSLYNVGSIFRSADGAGVEKLWLCGITGYPPHPQIAKTALGAEQKVSWEHHKDVMTVLEKLKRARYQIVLLEQMEKSVSYTEFNPRAPVALVIGHEVEGVSDNVLAYCDAAIEIEMAGLKNSLNVSVAFGIIAYHLRACLMGSASK